MLFQLAQENEITLNLIEMTEHKSIPAKFPKFLKKPVKYS